LKQVYTVVLVMAKSVYCHYWNIDFGIVHKASSPQHIYICRTKPHTHVWSVFTGVYT